MARQKTTLKDIAELVGLSISTVSRALKGDKEIAAATRERVGKAAERLSYQPNVFARGLSTKNTRILALLTQGLHFSAFYRECLAAFETSAHHRNYYVLGCSVTQDGYGLQEYLPLLRGGMFAGVYFLDYSFNDAGMLDLSREVENAGVPYVAAYDAPDQPQGAHNLVRVDFGEQARQAVEHLLKLGHRHIALVTPWARPQFFNGYLRAYGEAGIVCQKPEHSCIRVGVIAEDQLMVRADEISRQVLELEPRPTALFVPKAILTGPLQFSLKRAGLTLPDDMAMISTKNVREFGYLDPPITSVSVDIHALAETATEMLVDAVEAKGEAAARSAAVPTELIIRESCGAQAHAGRWKS
ncbi:MAG: substrate-binding domain-containing protein [Nitrospiraceae bacterium]|nr:substrate-binding domain-containing protein [Nitrospiraceae bacterium]